MASQEEGSTGEADPPLVVGDYVAKTKNDIMIQAATKAVTDRLAFVFRSIYPSHVAQKRDFIEFYVNKNSKDELIQSLYDKPPKIDKNHVLIKLLSRDYGDLDPY